MYVKYKRKIGVATTERINLGVDCYDFYYHNGMKIRHDIIPQKDCKIITKDEFIEYIKKSGNTSLYQYT